MTEGKTMTREELEKLYYDFIDEYTNTYTCESAYVDLKMYRNACIRYGFEKARENMGEPDFDDCYESPEQVIAELDKEQDDKR